MVTEAATAATGATGARSGVVRRSAGCAVEAFDDAFVLYDPRRERITELNATAAIIWQLCDGTRTRPEVAALVADAYPDEHATVVADVERTIDLLLEGGSLELA
jgi:hypothetical protein